MIMKSYSKPNLSDFLWQTKLLGNHIPSRVAHIHATCQSQKEGGWGGGGKENTGRVNSVTVDGISTNTQYLDLGKLKIKYNKNDSY